MRNDFSCVCACVVWVQIVEDAALDPAQAPWTGVSRRERVVLLGVLYFLSLENLRDANILFNIFKKVRILNDRLFLVILIYLC